MSNFQYFKDLALPSSLGAALEAMQFTQPTPIQAASIPPALAGKDILGTAQTGTGKTAAFGIPLLASLYAQPGRQALILAPTRELAAQIQRVLRQMSKGSKLKGSLVVGGESFYRQAAELREGVDYLVATPGRLNDHLKQRTINLSNVSVLVLDEFDRMLDMGFLPQIESVMSHVPRERQTLLFSATLPKEVAAPAAKIVRNPQRIAIGATTQTAAQIREEVVKTSAPKKNEHLLEALAGREGRVLVFVRTKSRAQRLAQFLESKDLAVGILHGGRTQGQRKIALSRFREGTHPILVATDLAGRGIDVADIGLVINYDLPMTREDYIHRIGRTGRAGNAGHAINFVLPDESHSSRFILQERAQAAPAPSSQAAAPAVAKPHAQPTVTPARPQGQRRVGGMPFAKKERVQERQRDDWRAEKRQTATIEAPAGAGAPASEKPRFAPKRQPGDRPRFGEKRASGVKTEFGKKPRRDGDRPFPRKVRADKPRFDGERRFEDRPRFDDRPRFGQKPGFGEKRPFGEKRSFGDKPRFGEKRAFGNRPRFGEERPFGDKPRFGEKRPFGDKPRFGEKRSFGDKPRFGEKRSLGDKPRFGEKRPFGDKPWFGGKPGFGEKRSFGDKPRPFAKRPQRGPRQFPPAPRP